MQTSPLFRVSPRCRHPWLRRADTAFTLVEMLVVMSVIAVVISTSGPLITSISGAGEVNKAVYDIAGVLEQARASAMSGNTYVYIGFNESSAATSESARQTAVLAPDVGGRVTVAVIASRDGSRGYLSSDPVNSWKPTAQGFSMIGKLQRFNNLHMLNLKRRPTTGGMARPGVKDTVDTIEAIYNLGDKDCTATTPFDYPLGATGSGVFYTFTKVIQFDPQGVARIQRTDNGTTIARWMEIGLQ